MNRCPKCGESNMCAMEAGLPHRLCWCNHVEIPSELSSQFEVGEGCICKKCVQNYWEERNKVTEEKHVK